MKTPKTAGTGRSGELQNTRSSRTFATKPSSTSQPAAALRQPLSRRLRRARPTLTSTRQQLRIIRQAVLPQVVQTPVRPAAKAKALNQAAALPARTILATALNSPRIDWLGCQPLAQPICPTKNSTFNTQHSTFKKNENLENNSSDSHQHSDRYRYYARSNELHGIKKIGQEVNANHKRHLPPIFTFTDLPHHRTCGSAYGGFVLSHLAMCGKLISVIPMSSVTSILLSDSVLSSWIESSFRTSDEESHKVTFNYYCTARFSPSL